MPSLAIAPLTKLDAVNLMLADVGERPVNSLTGSQRLDVTRAIDTLETATRDVLEDGWWFNREVVRLTVDGFGRYNVPDNVVVSEILRGGPTDTGANDLPPTLVVRDRVLYDTSNGTDVFVGADAVYLECLRLLEFESLPSTARSFVYASASIRNQSRALGSKAVDQDLRAQASSSIARLKQEEIDNTSSDEGTLNSRFFKLMHQR